ncbi:MAG TPA: glucose 1-dehydrogenase [Candidatus Kryptonia bacterium]|nr:glucose 1-dehydrogenase [Candidatus Kryptonia bacterium]
MAKLANKIAIVTGAGSGIGRASAVLFAREGATVVVADINREGAETTARRITTDGGTAVAVSADVARADSVEEMIATTLSRCGRLDVLFNNAGIGGTFASFADYTEETFDQIIAVNLKGVFLGMKFGIPALLKSGGGVILNTASVAGLIGARGYAAYSASKGGVIQLTKVAALEYAKQNVRVNCICPGGVDTPILEMVPAAHRAAIARTNPMERLARPEELANLALFLASDDSSFATGGVFVADGGSLAQ